jgi:hypothetical protein
MLDIDDSRRPGTSSLYEKFITWGAPIQLRSATPIYHEPTKGEPANFEPPVSETPAIVEPVATVTELPDPAPGTLPSQFSF